MGFDSPAALVGTDRLFVGDTAGDTRVGDARRATAARAAAARAAAGDRARFADETNQLELRLAIIDARFDRLASRPDDAYRAFRRDTLTRARDLAARAHELESARQIGPSERRRVAALLVTLRGRVVALDRRHDEFGDRRRAQPTPGTSARLK